MGEGTNEVLGRNSLSSAEATLIFSAAIKWPRDAAGAEFPFPIIKLKMPNCFLKDNLQSIMFGSLGVQV